MSDLLPGVRSRTVVTERLRMHCIESGPQDGEPVVLVHGNLSTGRFFEHLMPAAPDRYRLIAPDMRGFGDTESVPIDATRGLRDWADDAHALVRALGIDAPPHLVGWSTAAAAIAAYAMDRPVASLTFVDPVSPYGFGGTTADGDALLPRRRRHRRRHRQPRLHGPPGRQGPLRGVGHLAAQRDEQLLLGAHPPGAARAGGDPARRDPQVGHRRRGYPGDSTPSENWPGVAPGTRGILNALSPKSCDWSGIVDLDPKPPVPWTYGTADIVIADGSAWEMGTLGSLGAVPGWPGADAFPPQPMVTQTRAVLERYGGRVEVEAFEGSGHFPVIDAADRWAARFFAFLDQR